MTPENRIEPQIVSGLYVPVMDLGGEAFCIVKLLAPEGQPVWAEVVRREKGRWKDARTLCDAWNDGRSDP